jgi:hypothetical protein
MSYFAPKLSYFDPIVAIQKLLPKILSKNTATKLESL